MRQLWIGGACVALSLLWTGCGEVREPDPVVADEAALGCLARCGGRQCGPDGCGGTCGTCPGGSACLSWSGQCIRICEPKCDGRMCGPDGCGGTCGTCPDPLVCQEHAGTCISCIPDCLDRECGPDGCGGSCGECGEGAGCVAGTCQACVRNCAGRECGADGCGGSCGTCPEGLACISWLGQCIRACAPQCEGRECGPDGCNGTCGTCPAPQVCLERAGICLTCRPNCAGRECGPDGCGGYCGRCGHGERCEDGRCSCAPETVQLRYSLDLAPLEQRCTPASPFEAVCDVAIHEWCASHGCANTGFGPVRRRGDSLEAVCLQAQLGKVAPGMLTRYAAGCPAAGLTSPSCAFAFHRLCRDHGHVSGFGPTSVSGFLVGVSCVDEARALKVPWAMLQDLGCSLWSPPGDTCRLVANRLCVALGYAAGFGPVDVFTEGVVVTCLQPAGGGPQPCRGGFACPPHLVCCLGVCAPLGACGP